MSSTILNIVRTLSIGQMKIDKFAPVTARRVRLHLFSRAGTACIREFKLFAARPPEVVRAAVHSMKAFQ